jgi:hypothetical protein
MCSRAVQMIGSRFGRLTVIASAPEHRSQSGRTRKHWLCECDCGARTVRLGEHLRSGRSTSCGCLRRELMASVGLANRKHGATKTVEFRIWQGLIQRCTNPHAPAWKNYGGRGIRVCETWLNSFESFLADVGLRPHPSLTLDRKDNDGNYEPGNVRWATRLEQTRNRRPWSRWTANAERALEDIRQCAAEQVSAGVTGV